MNAKVTVAILVMFCAGGCNSQENPRGTETGLSDLQDTVLQLSVEVGTDPDPMIPVQEATALLTGQVFVSGKLL